jgi:hypothetical protein
MVTPMSIDARSNKSRQRLLNSKHRTSVWQVEIPDDENPISPQGLARATDLR